MFILGLQYLHALEKERKRGALKVWKEWWVMNWKAKNIFFSKKKMVKMIESQKEWARERERESKVGLYVSADFKELTYIHRLIHSIKDNACCAGEDDACASNVCSSHFFLSFCFSGLKVETWNTGRRERQAAHHTNCFLLIIGIWDTHNPHPHKIYNNRTPRKVESEI